MKKSISIIFFLVCLFVAIGIHAQESSFLKATISVSPEMKESFQQGGRLLVYLTKQNEREPRFRPEITIGVNPENWNLALPFILDTRDEDVFNYRLNMLSGQDSEKYYYQVVYKQNTHDAKENVAGNLMSEVDSAVVTSGFNMVLTLSELIPERAVVADKFVKEVVVKSKSLSEFSGYPRYLRASILLPTNYFDNPDKIYPICYKIPGLNGRFDAVNGLLNNEAFMEQRNSKDAPQVIYVFLDSRGPYGDTYQMDSENNGPCGKALTEELIPEIEKLVHYNPASKMRFLAGCSTGGWVALGLQVFYPDFFDGAWSYSPDPIDFEHYGLVDIYNDENIFYNRYGYLTPAKRTIYGEPRLSIKDRITEENVNSRTCDYRVSGGQFGAYNAVFGPKGNDGLPSLMFDPTTGKINHAIAKQWEKYDLKKVLKKNWTTLGPKLQGKIWIWSGDMDGLYSNVATRFFKMYLDKTENPKSDAKVSFTPMAGHCKEWSDQAVLSMIAEKVSEEK